MGAYQKVFDHKGRAGNEAETGSIHHLMVNHPSNHSRTILYNVRHNKKVIMANDLNWTINAFNLL